MEYSQTPKLGSKMLKWLEMLKSTGGATLSPKASAAFETTPEPPQISSRSITKKISPVTLIGSVEMSLREEGHPMAWSQARGPMSRVL